ncbi:ornithine carbamoyltransferase [Longimicrobium terrae]|uniref:Ornithine carbamoyltransferase n=1 Tax=Longimicrobium terrae TaxID=1639882 RepID=A0A841GVP3_9BACT|nr:ornithine carbamoyltransferase [Longimicrobium terrae]MBB4635069.1 ornithine carbamoyltransferase [Longimicrobium terrae]MBB6069463.1 ornithine carbamoyltransferase [Longimicrobium terrae]NNC31734.1 ornithine carbamoyltransferase [Longimicrobium terrae]
MSKRHLVSLGDLSPDEMNYLVDRGVRMRELRGVARTLEGKTVGIWFRKTSTRTRTSFTVGAQKLGADIISYGPTDLQTNTGESIEDTSRVLSGFLDALVVRTAEDQREMTVLAGQDSMSVVNAMADLEHPSQALADLTTMKEHFGRLEGLHVLYMGEGNNSATALALALAKIPGARLTLLTPPGYGMPAELMERARADAAVHGAVIEESHDAADLPREVDVVYTTRWQTTGSSKAHEDWRERFAPFAVTPRIMRDASRADGTTVFMHDLPAVRGEEVEGEVLDGPQSIAFRQAENKLYSAMAVLEWCVAGPQNGEG